MQTGRWRDRAVYGSTTVSLVLQGGARREPGPQNSQPWPCLCRPEETRPQTIQDWGRRKLRPFVTLSPNATSPVVIDSTVPMEVSFSGMLIPKNCRRHRKQSIPWHHLFQEALWLSRLPRSSLRLTPWPLSQKTVCLCPSLVHACVSLPSQKGQGLRTGLCVTHPESLQLGVCPEDGDLRSVLTPTWCLRGQGRVTVLGSLMSSAWSEDRGCWEQMLDMRGSSKSSVEQGQRPQSSCRQSEMDLKLWAQAPHRRACREATLSVQSQHWADGKAGRACPSPPKEERHISNL